jgi:vacuolar-type H+-ATPase subunit F/Vma7
MFDKVAVVGEADIIFPLRALGVKVFSPKNLEEARQVMETLRRENFALCFLHESFLEPLAEEREALREKFCPVVVGFSDYRKVTDELERMMREVAIKATGSDSMVKKREENERR